MSRFSVVAAFIAGAALVAMVVVVSDPNSSSLAEHSLAAKKAMLKHMMHATAHKNHFLQGLDVVCEMKPSASGDCGSDSKGVPNIFQDGCCYPGSRVCELPTDIWCPKGTTPAERSTGVSATGVVLCAQPKKPAVGQRGYDLGVNLKNGWSLPQGCTSTCFKDGQACN